jgi:hypothetical protein
MSKYVIRNYQEGVEKDQARIGIEVARSWIWPYAYHLEDLLKIHSQPDFDPDTRHYCYLDDQMVGYMFSLCGISVDKKECIATLDFPRMMPGHEQAAELLIEKAFESLRKKGVVRVVGRVTTICPGDILLAEKMKFSISDWGYKVYYSYKMGWGSLKISGNLVDEVDQKKDLDECAEIASKWYKRPAEWCRSLLEEWHETGVITHLCVRDRNRIIAACLVAPNDVRSSTAAIYYIYAPGETVLRPMLVKVVNNCINYGVFNVIADLVHEHRQFESVYQDLGFKKVAEWARVEKVIT